MIWHQDISERFEDELSPNEELVFWVVCDLRNASSTDIVTESSLPRSSVYKSLNSLLRKCYICSSKRKDRYHYSPSQGVLDAFRFSSQKSDDLLDKYQAVDLVAEVSTLFTQNSSVFEIEYFLGKNEIRSAFKRSLTENQNGNMLLYSSPLTVESYFDEYMHSYETERIDRNIQTISILTDKGSNISPGLVKSDCHDQFKYVDNNLHFTGDFAIYDHRICYAAFSNDTSFIIHTDSETASAFSDLFMESFFKI